MKLRALVIDDARMMRHLVMQSLTKTNLAEFEFTEAEDGVDALAKFQPDAIDIAFVDWNMPNMNGIDFVRKVRAMEDTEHIPMVMVTSEKTMGKIQEAMDEARADGYICKPFTVEELQHKLKKMIEKIQLSQLRRLREQRLAQEQKKPAGFMSKLFG